MSMYYSISRSNELNEIGHYPQAELKKGYNPRDNGHFMVKQDEFPDFNPKLELEMHPKAIPTNYLDSNAGLNNGFIIDNDFRLILSSFNLPDHRFYPVKVYSNGELLNYYWFHFLPDNFWEMIDCEKSYMQLIANNGDILNDFFPISSKKEIIKSQNSYDWTVYFRIGHIYMKPEAANFDLYKTDCLGSNILISKKLKDAIIDAHLTGMEIKYFNKFTINN